MLQFNDEVKLERELRRQSFAKQLRKIRVSLQLTAKDFAELTEIYPTRMSDYELAKIIPTIRTLKKLVEVLRGLGVSEYDIELLQKKHKQSMESSSNNTIGRIVRELA